MMVMKALLVLNCHHRTLNAVMIDLEFLVWSTARCLLWLFGLSVVLRFIVSVSVCRHSLLSLRQSTSDWCVALDFEIVLEISLSVR